MKPFTLPRAGGFTRTDMVSLLACFGLLSLLVVATGSVTRSTAEAVACQNNHRHIIGAWLTHAQDNTFMLGARSVQQSKIWGSILDWATSPQNTNVATVLTPDFQPYIGQDAAVFRCPTDRSVSPSQQSRGWRHRVRTYSMNAHVGAPSTDWGGSFPTYQRLHDFTAPSATFVFAEEHPGSINDSSFAADPQGTRRPANARIIDFPASFHNRGAHFGFADGHVELTRWVGPRAVQPVTGGRYLNLLIPAPHDPDALWLGEHAAQLR
jgi:prepilin-type processing-associated H-X9-DG protein